MKRNIILISCFLILISCEKQIPDIENAEIDTNNDSIEYDHEDECLCGIINIDDIIEREPQTEEEEYYLNFFKNYFIEQYNWSPEEFDERIIIEDLSFNNWVAGTSFRVVYYYINDWIRIRNNNSFIIFLKSEYSAYHHLEIPRDTYLDEEWLSFCVENNIAHSEIYEIKPQLELKYGSCKEAINSVKIISGYERFKTFYLRFYVSGNIPRVNGHPYFLAFGIVGYDDQICVRVNLDLITGEHDIFLTPCHY